MWTCEYGVGWDGTLFECGVVSMGVGWGGTLFECGLVGMGFGWVVLSLNKD